MEKYASPIFEVVHKILEENAIQQAAIDNPLQEKNKLEILPWNEFDQIGFPETEWWIKDLVPASCIVLIAAPSGEKKSWVALEMARCIVLGIPFAGTFHARKANVLYIEQETPQYLVQKRGRQLGINAIEKGVYFLSQDILSLNDPRVIDQLFAFIQTNEVKVVFVDTLRSVAGGIKEEKAEEVRAFFARFKAWKDRGVSVVIMDHCRKPQRWEGAKQPKKDQILGSQDKVAAVEMVHMLHSEERSEEIFFYPIKSKISREANPFKLLLRFEDREGLEAATMSHGGAIEEKKLKSEKAKHLIDAYLREAEDKKTAKEIQDALQEDAGKTAVEDALKEMRNDGRVNSEKQGNGYRYWMQNENDAEETLPNNDLGRLF